MTAPGSRSKSGSEYFSAFTVRTHRAPGRAPVSDCRSRSGSPSSTAAASSPTKAKPGGPGCTSTFRSYDVLSNSTDSWFMYSVNPEHAIGIVGGLLALPIALIAPRLHPRWRSVPGTVRAAAVLMAVSGGVHLALIPRHLATEPVTSVLFLLNDLAFIALAATFTWRYWRLASAGLLISTVLAYLVYVGIGLEGPDQVGLATKLVEVTALGLALVPVRGEVGRMHPTHRTLRWASLGVAMPLLIVMTGATVWIVDLARPDARHVHAGALLQSTNTFPTPPQVDAANRLYAETKGAIQPYADWHQAFAAGYRPGGSQTLPSTHWMNQKYVDAGYVMDPNRPQGLVYANTHHGPVLLGAMFQMKSLNTFGPDPGGPLTAWHQHENICFTPFGLEFSLMSPFGTCTFGAIDISASPMLHVWVVDNPKGGPFAVDIDPSVVAALDRA